MAKQVMHLQCATSAGASAACGAAIDDLNQLAWHSAQLSCPRCRKEDVFKMWCAAWSAMVHEGGAHPERPRNAALRRARFEEWWEAEGAQIFFPPGRSESEPEAPPCA